MAHPVTAALPLLRRGFRVEAPLDLAGWQPLSIGRDIALVDVPGCPACQAALRTVCTLVGGDHRHVRLGTCPSCGHTTYVDRPREEWFADFYRDTWDRASQRALDAEIQRRRAKLEKSDLGVERAAVRLARRLPIDRTRPVCEIGCGYGSSLQQLARAGFTRLVGVEASRHRAQIVRGVIGADVFTSAFEAPDTQAALSGRGPFSVIFSIHALEHTYHPERVLAGAASLQRDGDYLILSVPDLHYEPTAGVVFFLPHLHAFTRASLAALAARHGYHVAEEAPPEAQDLNIVFRRGERGSASIEADSGVFERTVEKFERGLALDQNGLSPRRRLWWLKREDRAGQMPWSGVPDVDRAEWEGLKERHRGDTPRAMLVSDLTARRTDVGESPLEIQFAGAITLFYK